jgi:hypothetical protein
MAKIHYALTHLSEFVSTGFPAGWISRHSRPRASANSSGTKLSFMPACAGPGAGDAQQLAGGEFALAPGHRAQDPGGDQAGQGGTLDAVPPHPGVHRRRRAGRGVRLLPHGSRRRRHHPPQLRSRPDLRRQIHHPAIRQQPGHPGPRPRLEQDPHRRGLHRPNWRDYLDRHGGSISDNGGRSCINASAIVVPQVRRRDRRRPRPTTRALESTRPEDRGARCRASPIRRWPISSTPRSRTG